MSPETIEEYAEEWGEVRYNTFSHRVEVKMSGDPDDLDELISTLQTIRQEILIDLQIEEAE